MYTKAVFEKAGMEVLSFPVVSIHYMVWRLSHYVASCCDAAVARDTRAAAASKPPLIAADADAHGRGAIDSVLVRCRCTFNLSLHAW